MILNQLLQISCRNKNTVPLPSTMTEINSFPGASGVLVLGSMMLQQDGYLLSRRFKPSFPSQIHTPPVKRCPSPPCHSTSLSLKETFLSAEHIKPSLNISLNLPRHFHPFNFFPISSTHDLLPYPSSFLSLSILLLPPELKLLSLLSVISSASVICV